MGGARSRNEEERNGRPENGVSYLFSESHDGVCVGGALEKGGLGHGVCLVDGDGWVRPKPPRCRKKQ